MHRILLIQANNLMLIHNLVIIFTYIFFYILRKPLLNIGLAIASALYMLSLLFFRLDYCIAGGVISFIAFIGIIYFARCSNRIYIIQKKLSVDLSNKITGYDVSFNNSNHTLTISNNYKKCKNEINRIYNDEYKTLRHSWILSIIFSCLLLLFLFLQLYFHIKRVQFYF